MLGAMMRFLAPCLLIAAALSLSPRPGFGDEEPVEKVPPWFSNQTAAVGLAGVKAKDCMFVDLDGNGWLDLCLDRGRFHLSKKRGQEFAAHERHGIEQPEIRKIPLDEHGEPDESKARDITYIPQYCYFADVNGDGKTDAICGVQTWWRWFDGRAYTSAEAADPGVRSQVWLGKGRGRFVAAEPSAYSSDEHVGPVMALAICDVDGDGILDLFEGRQYIAYGRSYSGDVDLLWKGAGDGTFTDGTQAAGLMTVLEPARPNSSRPTYGVTHGDWDGDGDQDLFALSYGRRWNRLWRNEGDGTFVDVGMETGFAGDDITHGRYPQGVRRQPEAPFRANGNTFDCALGDLDGDGDLDAMLGEIAHRWAGESSDMPAVLFNGGADAGFQFTREPVDTFLPAREFRSENWNYGDLHVAFLDFDNDTRMDILIGSGDYPDGQYLRLYQQQEDGSFDEVTELAGFDWEGCGGLSLGDYDRDGDVDILAGRSFARLNKAHRERFMGGTEVNEVGLFRNDIANRTGNHWVTIKLEGKGAGGSNRDGIGARILVTAGGKTQMREIRCGSGLSNHQDALQACFGLGKATKIDRIEVRWSRQDPTPQIFEDVQVDQHLTIQEGRSRLR